MAFITSKNNEGVFTVKLNRPEALNSFTPAMLSELLIKLTQAQQDSDVNVIIIKGEGRAFSAGVDLKVLQGIEPSAGKIGDVFDAVANELTRTIRELEIPVIAQVHGACFTGALEIALSCDFIFAESSTKFGDTHAQWGLRPTWGMAQNLARAVGVRRARQLSYSASVFTGQQAAEWGLVNESIEGLDALDHRVNELAHKISAGSTGAIKAYKTLYRLSEQQLALETALEAENQLEFTCITDTQTRLDGFGSK